MACYDCGNTPTAPNYLNTYEDADGEEYDVCCMCEDFEADYCRAKSEKVKSALATTKYGLWQRLWYAGMEKGQATP